MGALDNSEPGLVEILGTPMQCEICDHDHFHQREGMVHTTGMTFFDVDWPQPAPTAFSAPDAATSGGSSRPDLW